MKKILLFSIFIIFILPIFVQAESKYLYDVLRNEAENGGLAKEYTRDHRDSFTKDATDKIYHWYAETSDQGNMINNKNNVLLGNYCWKTIRTTDTGGTKVLFNGLSSNGACPGTNNSIGSTTFVKTDYMYYLGAIGYMHNELYSPTTSRYFNFGKLNQTGTKLESTDYNVISNSISGKTCQPYNFNSSKEWKLDTSCLQSDTSITFKINENGNYILNYNYDKDWDIDRVQIYINNVLKNEIGLTSRNSIILNNLRTTDEIKVNFDAYKPNDQRTELTFSINKPVGEIVDTRFNFGNDVEYSNGTYTLKNVVKNDGSESFKNLHYFCSDGSLSCETVYYIISASNVLYVSYKAFSNGKKIEDLINDQLRGDNVNVVDSPMKELIDRWYESNLQDYSKYFENALFCQKRTAINDNSFINRNNGIGTLDFVYNYSYDEHNYNNEKYLFDTNLNCDYETDMYSTSNPKAKLKYPVATISYAEALLLSKGTYTAQGGTVRSNGIRYWVLTPYYTGYNNYGLVVNTAGSIDYSYGANTQAVRPMVSLRPEATYITGDGSISNPYIINSKLKYKVNVQIKNETKDINIDLEDLTQVQEDEEVNFTITSIKGYELSNLKILDSENNEIEFQTLENNKYKFIMPANDVTIIPSYEKVKNSIILEENENTKYFTIEVNDASAVVYEEKVRFKLEPKKGYELVKIDIIDKNNNKIKCNKTKNINEFEFIMPDTDVIIKPSYKRINTNIPNNPKTEFNYFIVLIIIISMFIGTYLYKKQFKKNIA